MKRCRLDKIASVTRRLELGHHALLGAEIPAEPGTVVACRVLNAKSRYNTLEDVHGRMVLLRPGDVVAGALGHRDALHGYSGHVPANVAPGDELHLLNLGGVIGRCEGTPAPGIGQPFRLEVLGTVLDFPRVGERVGEPASIARAALTAPPLAPGADEELPPIVAVVGTSMNSGKTTAACALIAAFCARGLSVAAGKLTGVSLRRDVHEMEDYGADPVALFTDFGVVTTDAENAPPSARALIAHLAHAGPRRPDALVLEFGDGLLGTYGVDALLRDPVVRGAITTTVLCAHDPVGAWGAVRMLDEQYGLEADVITGPLTSSHAGLRFCAERLHRPAWNALEPHDSIADLVLAGAPPSTQVLAEVPA